MKTVIMAGGKGTRISSIASDIPKPMIKIGSKPVLEHEIDCLRRYGLTDIVITVGHLSSVITDYFGDGREFGVNIEYYVESEPLGNAGALYRIKDKLGEEFLLLNADAVFDIDFDRFIDFHKKNSALATILVHPNSHPFDSSLIVLSADKIVKSWLTTDDPRPQWYKNTVNAGMHILSTSLLSGNPEGKVDLDRDILRPLAGTGTLYAYESPEYIKDMGTVDRYYSVCKDFEEKLPEKKNLSTKQRAIFLDRDGTINKDVGFLTDIDKLELIPNATEAVKKINSSEYLAIVATNQPVVARGEVSIGELSDIHNKLETLLGNEGAYLDAIYYCPHHPDKGFPGEVKELKIDCSCRKPKPGMLLKASEEYNIDLKSSWMIGDSQRDILAGKAAGCRCVLLSEEKNDYGQDFTARNLLEAIEYILKKER